MPYSDTSMRPFMHTCKQSASVHGHTCTVYIISWILYAYKINLQHLVSGKRTWFSAVLLVMYPKLSSYLRYVHNKNAPKRDHYKFCLKTKALKCEPSCAVRSDTSRSKYWRAQSIHQKPSSSIAVPIERRTADWAWWRHASRKAPIPSCHREKVSKKYGWNFAIHVLLDYYIQDISIFGIESVPPISVHFWAPSPTCISAANSSSASSTSNSLALFAPISCASRGYQSWWTPEMTPRWLTD